LPDDPEARVLIAWSRRQDGEGRDRMLGLYYALRDACIRALLESCLGAEVTRRLLDDDSMLLLSFENALDRALALERPDVLDERELGAMLRGAWPAAKAAARNGCAIPVRARFVNAYFEGKLPAFLGLDTPPTRCAAGPSRPFNAARPRSRANRSSADRRSTSSTT
jgi:hypothetical protein